MKTKTKTKTAAVPAPKRRGRPPGVKNKKKAAPTASQKIKFIPQTPVQQAVPAAPTPTVQTRPTIQLPLVLDVPIDLILAALGERLK